MPFAKRTSHLTVGVSELEDVPVPAQPEEATAKATKKKTPRKKASKQEAPESGPKGNTES
jgi:hypothetical protein